MTKNCCELLPDNYNYRKLLPDNYNYRKLLPDSYNYRGLVKKPPSPALLYLMVEYQALETKDCSLKKSLKKYIVFAFLADVSIFNINNLSFVFSLPYLGKRNQNQVKSIGYHLRLITSL